MKTRNIPLLAKDSSARVPSDTSYSQEIRRPTNPQSSDEIVVKEEVEQTADFLSGLKWLSPNFKMLADQRFRSAARSCFPYVLAQQKLGANQYLMDGAEAYGHIADVEKSAKMLTVDGIPWSVEAEKSTFFYVIPGDRRLHEIGVVSDLVSKGMDSSDLSCILEIGSLAEESMESDEYFSRAEIERENLSRAVFHLISLSGMFFDEDLRAAEYVFCFLSGQSKRDAIADVMVGSAGGPSPYLFRIGLRFGFDLNARSPATGTTALEYAERQGFFPQIAEIVEEFVSKK